MPATMTPSLPKPSDHKIDCMEIWGGNQAIDNAVSVPGIDVWVVSNVYQNDAAGGDVYYISQCSAGKISRFMLADVAGHGAGAGPMSQALHTMMKKNISTLDQSHFARSLNDAFVQDAGDGEFATALLSTYFAPSKHLVVTNAGHPRPLWFRAATGTWHFLDEKADAQTQRLADLPLGVIDQTDYSQFAIPLGKNDLVILYTDSLIEARNSDRIMLGEDGLRELLGQLNATQPQTIAGDLATALEAYRGGATPDDDQTIMVLHHNAADPPKQTFGKKLKTLGKKVGLISH